MATDLGKVGMRIRGTWDSSTAYEVLDAVYYNNGTYIAKQAVPANTLPTNTTYWQAGLTLPDEKNAGNYVDLTSDSYETLTDGYLVVDSQSVTSGALRIQVTSNNGNTLIGGVYMNITGNYQMQMTYIKAGLRLRVVQDVANTRKRFIPLQP